MHRVEDEQREGQVGVYVAVFASAAVFNVLFHVIPTILSFVGAPEPQRRTIAVAIGVAVAGSSFLIPTWRQAIAWLIALAGPIILGVWFSLKKTSDPNPVTALMAVALLPPSLIVFGGLRVATVWKAVVALILGAGLGEVLGHRLRGAVGAEATWLLAAAMIAAASLAQRPTKWTGWRWVIGFAAASTAVMLAAIQIGIGSMRLEYHLPTPKAVENSLP
jgi:hypothetical protein